MQENRHAKSEMQDFRQGDFTQFAGIAMDRVKTPHIDWRARRMQIQTENVMNCVAPHTDDCAPQTLCPSHQKYSTAVKCQNPSCAWTGPETEARHPSTCTYTRFCPKCGEVCEREGGMTTGRGVVLVPQRGSKPRERWT